MTWHLSPPAPPPWPRPTVGNQTVRTALLQFFQTSVSLHLLLRPWLYHVLNRKQSNGQPRVENGPTCKSGLILCHREWDWGQKASTDIGAQSEGRIICYPMDHCKASQLWLNIEQSGDLKKLPMPWPHPSETDWESPAVKLRTTNGTVMVKEISQAAPELRGRR